jgi:iron(III) transport system ATP-binding protein
MNISTGPKTPAIRNGERWGKRNTAGVAFATSLSFENISHDFEGTQVLSDVSVRAEPGEILCLLGPSGSGKTTLLRIAAGIEMQSSGIVRIDDRIVSGGATHIAPEKRGIGLVFQDYALFPHLTILENVRFGLRGVDRATADQEAMRMLARVGLDGYAAMYPQQLSGGEQQRVALARALAPRPGILLLDEPFSGLDARLRDSVRDEAVSLLRDMRATAVIVTHDPEEALRVGDHIALLRDGRLVQHGTGRNLYMRPADLFTARFFSELNQFHCRAENGRIHTPFGDLPAGSWRDGDLVEVCVRLADVLVEPAGEGGHDARPGVSARISQRRFVGTAEILELFLQGHEEPVRARIRAGVLPDSARYVRASISEGAALLFPQG